MQQCDQKMSSKYWWPDWQRSGHLFWRKHDACRLTFLFHKFSKVLKARSWLKVEMVVFRLRLWNSIQFSDLKKMQRKAPLLLKVALSLLRNSPDGATIL